MRLSRRMLPLPMLVLTLSMLACPAKSAKAPGPEAKPAGEADSRIEATFTPEDPVHRDTPAAPAESPPEKTDREFWTAYPDPDPAITGLASIENMGPFLLKFPWGRTQAEIETALPEGWKAVDYSNDYEHQLLPHGVTAAHYNFGFGFVRESVPTSPPGAGGSPQKSPRLTAYFIEGTLAGVEVNLIDSIATDEAFVADLKSMFGEPLLLREQIDQPEAGVFLKMITLVHNFGPAIEQIESTQEFKVMYLGPAPGDKRTLLNPEDRIFGRMLRVFDPRLFAINKQLTPTAPPS